MAKTKKDDGPKSSKNNKQEDEFDYEDPIKTSKNSGNEHNPGSPYFLHALDHPGQIFVSEPLRDGNYGEWVVDMSNALYAKNKIDFVGGSIPMPSADSYNLAHWMRCNAMVKGWLKSGMDKVVRSNVRYANTAREIWKDLEERFGK